MRFSTAGFVCSTQNRVIFNSDVGYPWYERTHLYVDMGISLLLTYKGIRVTWGYVWYNNESYYQGVISKTVSLRDTKTKLL